MRISLIVRPRDRMPWMEEVRTQVASLREAGHDVEPSLTFEEGDATRFARSAAESGVDLMIAAGGDGTVNEVVNGVAGTDWRGPLGIIPLGTANDFALGLGLPEDVAAAFEVARSGSDREVDLAQVNDRWFINVSTGGVAATATGDTPQDTKRLLGPLAYLVTGVQKLPDLEPLSVQISAGAGEEFAGEIMMYAVGNGRRTGAGSQVTPEAELDDGELDVLIVPGMTRMEFMALAPRIRAGSHLSDSRIRYFRTDELTVESGRDLSVNADGEPLSGDRFVYRIGRRLTLRVP